MKQAVWQAWGAAFNSVEGTRYGNGQLSVDYTDNVDTRFPNHVCLGPLVTTIDCAAAGGTVANVNGFALSGTMNATKFLYAIRGTKWAKIKLSDMTLISDGTETALAEAATDILYTKTAGGTQEISIGMAATAYRVITTVGNTTTDTHSANDTAELMTIFGLGWPADRIVGLQGNTIKGNVLTGSVTMDADSWSTIATISGEALTPTGVALDGENIIPGYDNGPYMLDSDANRFRPLIDEIDTNSNHCKGMTTWFPKGVMIPLADGMRFQKELVGRSVGPETYSENMSPIQGKTTGGAGTNRYFFMVVKNEVTDEAYICACTAAQQIHKQLDFYPLVTLTNLDCDAILYVGTALGSRTNPTLVFGSDDDVAWITIGRGWREYDDTNYTYATSGTWYGTEMRRNPEMVKHPKRILFETAGCNTSGETITVSLRVTDQRGVTITEQIGAPITSNGMQILKVSDRVEGWRIRPEITFASNTSSASPSIESVITIEYDESPLRVDA